MPTPFLSPAITHGQEQVLHCHSEATFLHTSPDIWVITWSAFVRQVISQMTLTWKGRYIHTHTHTTPLSHSGAMFLHTSPDIWVITWSAFIRQVISQTILTWKGRYIHTHTQSYNTALTHTFLTWPTLLLFPLHEMLTVLSSCLFCYCHSQCCCWGSSGCLCTRCIIFSPPPPPPPLSRTLSLVSFWSALQIAQKKGSMGLAMCILYTSFIMLLLHLMHINVLQPVQYSAAFSYVTTLSHSEYWTVSSFLLAWVSSSALSFPCTIVRASVVIDLLGLVAFVLALASAKALLAKSWADFFQLIGKDLSKDVTDSFKALLHALFTSSRMLVGAMSSHMSFMSVFQKWKWSLPFTTELHWVLCRFTVKHTLVFWWICGLS